MSREERGNLFGWRAHEAVQGWTASVDAKASIALLVEVAVAGGAVQAFGDEWNHASGVHLAAVVVTLAALGLSVGCALGVVFPRLARRQRRGREHGLLFFGHLRNRPVADIERGLRTMGAADERRQLAEQLQIMARVAWRKHTWLQASVGLLAVGAVGLVLTLAFFPEADTDHRAPRPRRELVAEGERGVTFGPKSHNSAAVARTGAGHSGSLEKFR